ncbi:hypothetical protein AB1Y20_005468 [Prymnesium parvum]|uniref:BTB domain-containing protein n=1 Tax=Prymnesium parvum TaxID=97485 RepID=A0AB34J6K0_PRYPA
MDSTDPASPLPDVPPSCRVRLNVGGSRFETTVGTLTGHGKLKTFFSSLLRHNGLEGELFIDRDGESFGPLLSFLRTGELHVPPRLSEAALRLEADYYCISLPPARPARRSSVRSDGLYVSFSVRAQSGLSEEARSSQGLADADARAYLIFTTAEMGTVGSATLGRREADGQWSALQCRYICYPGGLLQVHRVGGGSTSELLRSEEEARDGAGGESNGSGGIAGGGESAGIELSAVVLNGEFIEVMQCGRVGRREQPFHFVRSLPPTPGTAFVSQVSQPGPGRGAGPTGAGRVVLSFESASVVGVMVTSSHPGWSSVAGCSYRSLQGHRGGGCAEDISNDSRVEIETPPTDDLCHLEIRNANFSRSADFVSLGEQGLVEFVQLNAQHQPQLIWYRPVLQSESPWS